MSFWEDKNTKECINIHKYMISLVLADVFEYRVTNIADNANRRCPNWDLKYTIAPGYDGLSGDILVECKSDWKKNGRVAIEAYSNLDMHTALKWVDGCRYGRAVDGLVRRHLHSHYEGIRENWSAPHGLAIADLYALKREEQAASHFTSIYKPNLGKWYFVLSQDLQARIKETYEDLPCCVGRTSVPFKSPWYSYCVLPELKTIAAYEYIGDIRAEARAFLLRTECPIVDGASFETKVFAASGGTGLPAVGRAGSAAVAGARNVAI